MIHPIKSLAAKRGRYGILSVLVVCVFFVIEPTSLFGQRSIRIIDQEPYDLLTLKDNPKPLKLEPFQSAKRRPIVRREASEKLLVRLLDKPDSSGNLVWQSGEFRVRRRGFMRWRRSVFGKQRVRRDYLYR